MFKQASTRRRFFQSVPAAAVLPWLANIAISGQPVRKPRVAVVYTVNFFRSHAFNFLENCLRPLLFNGRLIEPMIEVASLYADQIAEDGDLTHDTSHRFGAQYCMRIADALTLGTDSLAVDGVLLIGEHGTYPDNALGQREYPRKRFFDEIVTVMRRSNRFVPIFNDKHLSYRWDWAKEMYDTAQRHRIPFMAGSSVPLAQRRPALEIPADSLIEEAVSIHGGGFESYDFHGLEVLQSMVEARRDGETGVASVEFLEGDELFRAADEGRWSRRLADAALRAEFGDNVPDLRRSVNGRAAHGILVSYRDGLKATVLRVGSSSSRWSFACKLSGEPEPRATFFYNGPWGNRNLFMALTNAIQHFVVRRESPYPVERTLLTTGALDAAVHSRAQRRRILTPHLSVAYQPFNFQPYREMGASWQLLRGAAAETRDIRELPLNR